MNLKCGTNPHQAFAAAEPVAPGTEPLRLRNGSPSLINLLDEIAQGLAPRPKLSPADLSALLARVEERQRAVGYDGDYEAWMRKVTPPDLE